MEPIRLVNESLSLEILPSVGGKISSIFDKSSGQEWLWTNPWLPLRQPVYGESYVGSLDFGGWDEIFPSVDPCRIPTPGGEAMATIEAAFGSEAVSDSTASVVAY